jgi:hypothetical protein
VSFGLAVLLTGNSCVRFLQDDFILRRSHHHRGIDRNGGLYDANTASQLHLRLVGLKTVPASSHPNALLAIIFMMIWKNAGYH